MTILKKLAMGMAGAVGLFLVVGLLLPRTAHVERSIVAQAPPATVFTILNGFRVFDQWSPWAGIDPEAKTTFEGPPAGVGAKMSWAGNAQVGTGSQEILESAPHERIRVRLVFGDFPGEFTATYLLAPEAGGTRITWQFDADYGSSIFGRYFGLLADRMVGPDYEKGLAQLKALVERMPAGDFSGLAITLAETSATPIVYVSIRAGNTVNAIGVALGVAYSRVSGFMQTAGLAAAGPPVAIFRGKNNGTLDLDAAIPVDRTDVAPAGGIRAGALPAGRAVKAEYRGSYAGLAGVHEQLRAYLAAAGLTQAGAPWEQYMSDRAKTAEADLVTHIYYPIR